MPWGGGNGVANQGSTAINIDSNISPLPKNLLSDYKKNAFGGLSTAVQTGSGFHNIKYGSNIDDSTSPYGKLKGGFMAAFFNQSKSSE